VLASDAAVNVSGDGWRSGRGPPCIAGFWTRLLAMLMLTIICTTGSAEPQGEVGSLGAPTVRAWGDALGRDPPLAVLLDAVPGIFFPASSGIALSPGPLVRLITISRFVHSMTGDLMLMRPLGGMVLRAEVRSVAMLLASLEGFFGVYVLEAQFDDFLLAVVVGMLHSRFPPHAAPLFPPHRGPLDPARVAAPCPRAEPLPTSQHARRGQLVGARAT
jgi:hypothetical protein